MHPIVAKTCNLPQDTFFLLGCFFPGFHLLFLEARKKLQCKLRLYCCCLRKVYFAASGLILIFFLLTRIYISIFLFLCNFFVLAGKIQLCTETRCKVQTKTACLTVELMITMYGGRCTKNIIYAVDEKR